jgi:hypothetical protein
VPSLRTPGGCDKVAAVLAVLPTFVADAAEEGRDVILGMLVTGLIFIAVIALGELSRWAGKRRRARRPRAY